MSSWTAASRSPAAATWPSSSKRRATAGSRKSPMRRRWLEMAAPTRDLPSEDYSRYAFKDDIVYATTIPKGLSEETVRAISKIKNEPEWMLNFRLRSYRHFVKRAMPSWGG